ncbi:hypothetical protein [Citrobacter freundii]|uniref:hypothetical protein n=1 Tax=Citrobacter freundii TaxID=546 RepID=UPI00200BB45A|nr:hypothetical protein [Citrobacter freundii]UQI38491.1 hypothetical protein M3L74_12370 [Citrobacter freundii]
MNITGNGKLIKPIIFDTDKPIPTAALLDLLRLAAVAEEKKIDVQIEGDFLGLILKELILYKSENGAKEARQKQNPPQPQWQSPDNPGFAIKPMPGHALAICKTGDFEALRTPELFTKLWGPR